MLPGFWYRALPADTVFRERLERATLLETPLVIGRDAQNRPFALQDACPHRGMPLSCGRFDGHQVECSYHGWRFDAHSGQCQLIPSLTSDQKLRVDRIYAGSYACEENDGFIWVFIPEPAPAGAGFSQRAEPAAGPPRVPTFSEEYKLAYLTSDLPCSVDHGIIGLMDPAHGPFVHQAWWWRSRDSIHEKQKVFEPIDLGFRMSAHTPSSNSAPYKLLKLYADAEAITTTIDFTLPNMRWETIRAGKYWFSSLTTVTPIRRSRCRIDVVAAEPILVVSLRRGSAEVRIRKVRRAGSQNDGAAIRRTEAQSAPDADRRRGPPGQMVLPTERGMARLPTHRRSVSAPDDRPGHAEVAELGRINLSTTSRRFRDFGERLRNFGASVYVSYVYAACRNSNHRATSHPGGAGRTPTQPPAVDFPGAERPACVLAPCHFYRCRSRSSFWDQWNAASSALG